MSIFVITTRHHLLVYTPFLIISLPFLVQSYCFVLLTDISYLDIRFSSCEVPVYVPVSSSPCITNSLIPDSDKDPLDDLTKWAKIDCDDHSLNWTPTRLSFVRTFTHYVTGWIYELGSLKRVYWRRILACQQLAWSTVVLDWLLFCFWFSGFICKVCLRSNTERETSRDQLLVTLFKVIFR